MGGGGNDRVPQRCWFVLGSLSAAVRGLLWSAHTSGGSSCFVEAMLLPLMHSGQGNCSGLTREGTACQQAVSVEWAQTR